MTVIEKINEINEVIKEVFTFTQSNEAVKADFDEYDYLIAMEQYNLRNIRREFGDELTAQVSLLLDYTDTPGDIDDPWYSGGFDVTYKEIKKGCEGFLRYLGY